MINIDSHSFNNSVLEQINKIKTALSKITPDNIKYFDDSLLRKARGVVNSTEEYKWKNNSYINSVPCKNIKSLTDFLKVSRNEYIVLDDMSTVYTIIPEDFTTGSFSFGSMHVEYDVPDGFDGRNSFIKSFKRFRGDPADVSWGESKWRSNNGFEFSKTALAKTKSKISYNSTVELYDAGFAYTYIEYVFLVVIWRKK